MHMFIHSFTTLLCWVYLWMPCSWWILENRWTARCL